MEPGGCKHFLGRADQKDNFQLLATFFSPLSPIDTVTTGKFLENVGLIKRVKP